eukprot:CAMPEP_0182526372 /NCGR_PEP_ID=MMETSP1323-20130603/3133_1 /TAXON_ID=236787 /ORGANISM="Florenciella parvula, Strain RCC1693" /LENGTH=50 /DNA_ID=CAMNT_0024735215 /DNA_START=92 /DNA_END=244 /DNA_ORIENTATION=+
MSATILQQSEESSKSSTGTTDTTATAKGSYQHLVPQGITLWHMQGALRLS